MSRIEIVMTLNSYEGFKEEIEENIIYEEIYVDEVIESGLVGANEFTQEELTSGVTYRKREKTISVEEVIRDTNVAIELTEDFGLELNEVKNLYDEICEAQRENLFSVTYKEMEKFNKDAKCVTYLFERNLIDVELKGNQVFHIDCRDIVSVDKLLVHGKQETLGELDGFHQVQIPIDYKEFTTLADYEKKEEMLRLLMLGIEKITSAQGWSMKPFKIAEDSIIELDYYNEFKWKKSPKICKHPSKKLKAGVGIVHDFSEKSQLFLFVSDYSDNELYREYITEGDAAKLYLIDYKLKWQGDNKVVVENITNSLIKDRRRDVRGKLENKKDLSEIEIVELEDILKNENHQFFLGTSSEWRIVLPFNIIKTALPLPLKTRESNKKDAEKKFKKDSKKLENNILSELYFYRHDHYSDVYEGASDLLEKFLKQILKHEKMIGYIDISWLRTSIKNGENLVLVSAYDSTWFLDKEPVQTYYDATWILQYLHKLKSELIIESRKYFGLIKRPYIEKLMWDVFNKEFTGFIYPLFRNVIEDVLRLPEYKVLNKENFFCITFGEYMDATMPLWVESKELIDINVLKHYIQKKDSSKTIFQHFKDIDLSDDAYHDTNFLATRFDNVNLENAELDYCNLQAVKFLNCNLRKVDLSHSEIWMTDFSDSDLKNAKILFANYEKEADYNQIEEPIFNRITFKNADLTDACMQFSDLSGADFRGAILTHCDFTDAILYKALMDEKYMHSDELVLSDEQKEQITWI